MSQGFATPPTPQVPEWMNYLAVRLDDETPHADDDFFDDGNKSDWTEVDDTGILTWTESRGVMSFQGRGGTQGDTASALKSMGSLTAPVTVEAAVRLAPWDNSQQFFAGVGFASGTTFSTDYFAANMVRNSGTTFNYSSIFANAGALASWSTDQFGNIRLYGDVGSLVYLRTIWKSTNTWTQSVSIDGVSWHDQGSPTWGTTMTPTHFGLFVADYTGNIVNYSNATFEYFRVYESDLGE